MSCYLCKPENDFDRSTICDKHLAELEDGRIFFVAFNPESNRCTGETFNIPRHYARSIMEEEEMAEMATDIAGFVVTVPEQVYYQIFYDYTFYLNLIHDTGKHPH